MEPFKTLSTLAAGLPMKDVDTDLLIPAQYLTSTSRSGYGENLFRRLREADKNFFLNRAEYKDAAVLISDSNFGCGSSREHAVWALRGAGIRVVIAKSFADIFTSNSAKNGLLLITLKEKEIDTLLSQSAASPLPITINLEAQQLSAAGVSYHFDYDPFRKHCLLNGLEDLEYILSHKDETATYWLEREKYRFFKTTTPNR